MLVNINEYDDDYGFMGVASVNPDKVQAIKYCGDYCYIWLEGKSTIKTDCKGAQAIINITNMR